MVFSGKGNIYIEPARDYDTSAFKISTSSDTKETMIEEAQRIMQSVKGKMERLQEAIKYFKQR